MIGETVEWIQDSRPMPDYDDGPDSPAWDMSLVQKRQGVVQAISRTIIGQWIALVKCDNHLVEIPLFQLILSKGGD
jgi:hypothetical protein